MKHKPRKSKLITNGSTLYTLEETTSNTITLQRQRVYAELPKEEVPSPMPSTRKYKMIGRKRQAETPLLKHSEEFHEENNSLHTQK